MNKIMIVAAIPGKVTCQICLNLPAPSIAAASYKVGTMATIAAIIND